MFDEKTYEQRLRSATESGIKVEIAGLEKDVGAITARTERLKNNPESVLLTEKMEQLQAVLEKYGKTDCRALSTEQIAMTFVRIQGEEAIIREDIAKLSAKENQNAFDKKLVIARRVLSERNQHGGRGND